MADPYAIFHAIEFLTSPSYQNMRSQSLANPLSYHYPHTGPPIRSDTISFRLLSLRDWGRLKAPPPQQKIKMFWELSFIHLSLSEFTIFVAQNATIGAKTQDTMCVEHLPISAPLILLYQRDLILQ